MIFPARNLIRGLIFFSFFVFLFLSFKRIFSPVPVFAQGGISMVATTSGEWVLDAEVTEVGKNAERARQFLWWTLSHPGIHYAPVLARLWGFSRNMVIVFVILVIVAIGFSYILLRRRANAINIPPLLVKIGAILLYATFSYILILAFVQTSDILMKFFIEHVGGQNLFNVIFAGAGNMEENYTSFVGYRNTGLINQEMANTSLFLIRMTSLSYFVMALVLILRTIILWFLLILSPFLAILIPFVFIRNIGWIWIGVFFQWLFYGPLMALFLGAITNIWVNGIPYGFNFIGRAGCAGPGTPRPECVESGQVYRTAINILYGGPAQTLSPGNSANYIDTYAEYVISLVMLWAAMLLPWLLLRIFRDYCCEVIAASHATLTAIFDRLRQYPPPPPPQPVVPTTTAGMAVELPFRSRVEERIKEVQRTKIEEIKEISKVNTSEIVRAMDLSVSSLSDVSKMELNQERVGRVRQNLDKLVAPEKIASLHEREQYATLRKELQTRAFAGDRMAQTLLVASEKNPTVLATYATTIAGRQVSAVTPAQKRAVYVPQMVVGTSFQPKMRVSTLTAGTLNIAKQVNVSDKKVREVLENLPVAGTVTPQTLAAIAQKTAMPASKVQEIITASQVSAPPVSAPVSIEDYEEVKKMWLNHYRSAPIPETEKIKDRQTWLVEEEKNLTNIYNLLISTDPKLKQKGLEKVAEILPFMLLGGFSDTETLAYIKAKDEACNQVTSELEVEERVKRQYEEATKEEEATLVEIPSIKKEEGKESVYMRQKMEIPIEETPLSQKTGEEIPKGYEKRLEDIKVITKLSTPEIVKSVDISVSSLKDISLLEMDKFKKATVQQKLDKILYPGQISSDIEQKYYRYIRDQLQLRASSGDAMAVTVLLAGEKDEDLLIDQVASTNSGVFIIPVSGVFLSIIISQTVMQSVVTNISLQTGISETKLKEIIDLIPSLSNTTTQTISAIAQQVNLPEPKVKEIITLLFSQVLSQPSIIQTISRETSLDETKVKEVLRGLPMVGTAPSYTIANLAQQINLPEEKVMEIVKLSNTAKINIPAPIKKPVVNPVTFSVAGKTVSAQVSLEDYEEVKKMWLNHYRSAPVPVTEKIKDRQTWLAEEEKKLTNMSNLLTSSDSKLRKEGLEQVAEVLPFMLLGNYSDTETTAYVKAKLEADKQIRSELVLEKKVKEEVKKEITEEEETLLEVPAAQKEETKQKEQAKEQKMELPKEGTKTN